jgi:hypothetical protein
MMVKWYIETRYLFFDILKSGELDLFDSHQSSGTNIACLIASTESSTAKDERFSPLFALIVNYVTTASIHLRTTVNVCHVNLKAIF